jgi:proteasome lid subunit RPN8/RPN11
MALDPPGEIFIGRQPLTLLERLLDAAAPEEGCALVLGVRPVANAATAGPGGWRVRQVWPTTNVWEPASERCRRFRIDPREQLLAQKWARSRGLELLGSVHSHPASPPLPSATDRALACLPTLMLIRGLPERPEAAASWSPGPELRCWWLDPPAPPRLLPWRMGD